MSIGIQSLIWKAGPASKAELLLLLAIADHADDAGHAFPGVALLAKKSRDTTRNVLRVLTKLVAGGWVSVDAHQGRSSEYHIALRKVISLALASGDKLSPQEKRIVALHRDKLSPVERATHDITGEQPMTLRDQAPDISGSLYRVTTIEPSIETPTLFLSRKLTARKKQGGRHNDEEVERVYRAYPLKKAPARARVAIAKAFERLSARGESDPVAFLIDRIAKFSAMRERDIIAGRFVPTCAYPATWFNGECYDEPGLEPVKNCILPSGVLGTEAELKAQTGWQVMRGVA